MNYFLISFLLLVSHNDAEDINSGNRTHVNDSFSVHIGAGYGVGIDQSSNNLPKSTTKINKPRNYLSNILSRETTPIVREPRTLPNFTLQVENSKAENTNYQVEPKNHIFDSNSAASNNFGTNNGQSYQVHETLSDDNKFLNTQPSLSDLQKIISGIEKGQQYSKIVQVIKVPAIYEIHLQSDMGKKNRANQHPGNFNNGHFQWNNHYRNQPLLNNFNYNEDINWIDHHMYNEPPFGSPSVSDEYLKWLNNYYKQREETFSEGPEKYRNNHKSSSITSHEKYVEPQWMTGHLPQNDILEPIISHHYAHSNYFDDKLDDNGIMINYSVDGNNHHSNTWQNRKHSPHYTSSNLKRDIPSPNSNNFRQNNNLLHHKNFNSKPEPFKHNQEITAYNQPQAIYEVPAPYLGKYPHPRPFEAQSLSKTRTYSKPIPTLQNYQNELNHAQFNNYVPNQNIYDTPEFLTAPTTAAASFDNEQYVYPDTVYSLVSEKYHNIPKPEKVPSNGHFTSHINENQNLIYGKQTEAVLSPYEINIPATATTAANLADNQEHVIYKDTQSFQYPTNNVNYIHGSNYNDVHNPHILVHNKLPNNQIQNQASTDNINIYENVPITTHIPDVNLYHDKNQATFNQKSDTNVYKENNEKDKEQDNINSESKTTQNPKKSLLTDKQKKSPIRESPQVTKNMPNKRFRQKQYINNSPLRRRTMKENGGHLDYIIYITEKSRD